MLHSVGLSGLDRIKEVVQIGSTSIAAPQRTEQDVWEKDDEEGWEEDWDSDEESEAGKERQAISLTEFFSSVRTSCPQISDSSSSERYIPSLEAIWK